MLSAKVDRITGCYQEKKMRIEVNLFASLARLKPEGIGRKSWWVECDEGTTVSKLLSHISVPEKEVKLIFRNGVMCSHEETLLDGDRVGIFPPVGGG
jgi:molybdopterin converting factor small subunit